MDPAQAKLAFQVISERYDHRRSTAITTNRTFKDWTRVFPDPLNAQIIAERLTERSEVFLNERQRISRPQSALKIPSSSTLRCSSLALRGSAFARLHLHHAPTRPSCARWPPPGPLVPGDRVDFGPPPVRW
jgi:hypothetical protein